MRPRRYALALTWLAAAAAPAQPALQLECAATQVGRYEKIEFRIRTDARFQNPFDPDEADIHLDIQTPDGHALSLPAFFIQPFERRILETDGRRTDWLEPQNTGEWQARFAPMLAGKYTCVARWQDRASNPVAFECRPSASRGFLRVAAQDPRFFALDDGSPFFAIGQNLAFIGHGQAVNLARAETILRRMGENGANYARVWACCDDWALAIEARKSAWGRSWSWQPPFVAQPDDARKKCVQLAAGPRAAVAVNPANPVALRPATRYVLSGLIQAPDDARLLLERRGQPLGAPVAGAGAQEWTPFRREFTTGEKEWWLGPLRLRLEGAGPLLLRDLSLRTPPDGPELLEEADPNRAVLGYYNQPDCFMLDRLLAAAETNDIRLQLCLLTRNNYMDALKDPRSAAYDRAIHDARKALRYAVARWGYSTSVATWEYWNEQNPGLPTDRFYAETGAYLAQIDPYHHLRATSAWGPAPKDWAQAQLDVADLHWYLRPNWNELWKDAAAAAADRAQFLRRQAAHKPALLSEFGLADERWGLSPYMKQDQALLHFHDALWASALSGLAGTTLFWWWDQLDAQHAYPHYRALAAFTAGLPWLTAQLRPATVQVSPAAIRAVGLQGADCAYLWLSDAEATWWKMVVEHATPAERRDVGLELSGLAPGTYELEWWDTVAGQAIRRQPVAAPAGSLRAAAPPFARDIACRCRRIPD